MRQAPGLESSQTVKTRLARKVIKGIRQPGDQAYNYPSPLD